MNKINFNPKNIKWNRTESAKHLEEITVKPPKLEPTENPIYFRSTIIELNTDKTTPFIKNTKKLDFDFSTHINEKANKLEKYDSTIFSTIEFLNNRIHSVIKNNHHTLDLSFHNNDLTNDILLTDIKNLLPVIREQNLSLEVLNLEGNQNIKIPEIMPVLKYMYELNSLKELYISKNQVTKKYTTSSRTEKEIDITFMKKNLTECRLYIDKIRYY